MTITDDLRFNQCELDSDELLRCLTPFQWQRDCEIIPAYLPEHAKSDTKPKCVVRHALTGLFLRYSKGPRQGYFWDIYGEDMHSPELALVSLYGAPMPNAIRAIER